MPPENKTPMGSCSGIDNSHFWHSLARGADISLADPVQVVREGISFGLEETGIKWVGIGAADHFQPHYIMCRHHPGIGGVELVVQSHILQEIVDLIYSFGDDQQGAAHLFGEKVAHGSADGAGQEKLVGQLF